MGLTSVKNTAPEFELCPAGSHVAVLYQIIDLGTQERAAFEGQQRPPCQKAVFGFELPGKKMANGQPFTIRKSYNVFMSENAALRKDVEALEGRSLTEDELQGFDVSQYLWKGVLINVVHEERNGKTRDKIASIMPLPDGMQAPHPTNEVLFFDLDNFNEGIYNKLSKYLQDTIAKSPEYVVATKGWAALTAEAVEGLRKAGWQIPDNTLTASQLPGTPAPAPTPANAVSSEDLITEDDIPF